LLKLDHVGAAIGFSGDALPFVATCKMQCEPLAWAMLRRDGEQPRRGLLGFWLGEKHQGRGVMKEAMPAVVAAGFGLLNLDVVEAGARPQSLASFSVMRACGMKPVGERWFYVLARNQNELCQFYEIDRLRPPPR